MSSASDPMNSGPHPAEPSVSPYAWYVAGLLCLANALSFIDRTILALLVEPIRADLGLTDTQIGLLQGVTFMLFYSLAGIPFGRWVDKGNRPFIIAIGMLFWSAMTAASGLARSFWHLFAARVGVGVGEASLSPAALSLLADYFPRAAYGRAISLFSTGIWVGSGLALLLGGLVIGSVKEAGTYTLPIFGTLASWQVAFLAAGAPGIVMAVAMLSVREPRRSRASSQPAIQVPLAEVLKYLAANRGLYVRHFLAFALLTLFAYAALAWVPAMLIRVHGLQVHEVGLRWGTLMLLFAPAGAILGGWLADRGQKRGDSAAPMSTAGWGAVILSGVAMVFCFAPSLTMLFVTGAGLCALLSFPFGIAQSSLQLITPAGIRGQVSAIYFLVVNLIGYSLGPLLVGVLTQHVFRDPTAVNRSLAVIALATLPIAAALLFGSKASFRARAAQASVGA